MFHIWLQVSIKSSKNIHFFKFLFYKISYYKYECQKVEYAKSTNKLNPWISL